jgi:hypothetical protein
MSRFVHNNASLQFSAVPAMENFWSSHVEKCQLTETQRIHSPPHFCLQISCPTRYLVSDQGSPQPFNWHLLHCTDLLLQQFISIASRKSQRFDPVHAPGSRRTPLSTADWLFSWRPRQIEQRLRKSVTALRTEARIKFPIYLTLRLLQLTARRHTSKCSIHTPSFPRSFQQRSYRSHSLTSITFALHSFARRD